MLPSSPPKDRHGRTLATLIVLNTVLCTAARRVSADLLHLIPLLAAVISLIVGILTLRHVKED